jgi:2-desacetyl-2-hydroxyethyl bacteriochlorophyllide A dehydrogenase
MRATRLVDVRRFDEVDVPEPSAGPGDVLVRIGAVSICGSDLLGYLGLHPRIRPPTIIGHENAGVVESVGSEVTRVRPGDRVAVDPTFGCGTCRYCRQGRWNICPEYIVLGETDDLPGGLSGLVAVPEDHVHPLPAGLSIEAGAVVQSLSVAYHAAVDQGRAGPEDTVLVIGGGAIGLGAMLAAKLAGARVIVSDPLAYRLEMARSMGADHVVDPTVSDLEAEVRSLTDGYGADLVIEAVGGKDETLVRQGIQLAARGGRVVVVGLKGQDASLQIGQIKWGEKLVVGSQAHPNTFPRVIAHLADGSIDAERLITHRVGVPDIADAFALLADRAEGVMKVVVRMT